MGTRVAPTYANLFMSKLETDMLNSYQLKPKIWLRYIDDIFFIWEHGEEELTKWLEHLNNYHKTIKFTSEWSTEKINFLDTWVQKGQDRNKLYTNLHTKPTDTNSYLRYDSAHPPKCKESIPYSQFLRIKRICKEQTDFETNLEMKKTEFREKGYPTRNLDNAEKAIRELERSNLLKTNAKNKAPLENTVVLTTTYRQGEQYVPRTIKKNWDI